MCNWTRNKIVFFNLPVRIKWLTTTINFFTVYSTLKTEIFNILKWVHAQKIFIGREIRNTCVSFEFSSQSDVKWFRYYQLYCRIFVTTTSKPMIVYALSAHIYICMNSSEFVWLSGMCRWKKDRQTDSKTHKTLCMCIIQQLQFNFEKRRRENEYMRTCVSVCIFTLACVCLPAYLCTCMSLCECVLVSTKMKNGHEHSPIWIVVREIRLGIPTKPTKASVKMTLLYRVQKHINKTGRWWYASRS